MRSFERALDLATALQAYSVKQKPTGGVTSRTEDVNQLLQAIGLRKGSFDRLFPALFSLHGIDIKQALARAVKDNDITARAAEVATAGIYAAMEDISKRYPVMTEANFTQIDRIVQDFIDEFNIGGADNINRDKIARMSAKLEQLKSLFKQPYIVTYFGGSPDKLPSIKIAHNSFANLRDIVNKRIKESISVELTKNRITNSKLSDENYLTTKIINWGHTKADDSIISGKILAEMLSARNALRSVTKKNEAFQLIVKDFLEQTGQQKNVIKVHHGELTLGDPKVLEMTLSSGIFQTVIVQNRRENQEDLGQLEKSWNLLDAVGRKNLLGAFGVGNIQALANLLLKVKSSPSVYDNIEQVLFDSLTGKRSKKTKRSIPLLNNTTPIKKRRKKVEVKLNQQGGRATKKDPGTIRFTTQADLTTLLVLLNQHLKDQIRKNMGTGNSTSVLNYRTGRFAESVRVESLSESRQGMITAFYSYMKNPYATFSQGGQQELPRTRDPKLLISKSIREIVGQQVANRLRAVNV